MIGAAKATGAKVLCVEDEPEILRDMADELREQGFDVTEAPDAASALAAALAQRPDLVICDIQMPGMNGIDFLTELRARGDALSDVPFIFLTAFGDREHMLDGRRAGADDYLVKPVDYDLLIAAVNTRLGNFARRSRRERDGAWTPKGIPGRDALLSYLRDLPDQTDIAVLSIDNPRELVRRIGDDSADYFGRLSRRLDHQGRARLFHLEGFDFVLVGGPEAQLEPMLARMADLSLRDGVASTAARARVSASIAIGRHSPQLQPEALLEQLVEAMRLIQNDGGARILTLDDPRLRLLKTGRVLRSQILPGLRNGEFNLCFQPKIRLSDGAVAGAEVLLRWNSPDHGAVSPDVVVSLAEREGLMAQLSDWVFGEVAAAQARLSALGHDVRLAVNVSTVELQDDLPDRICSAVAAKGGDPSRIDVEITETVLVSDFDRTSRVASELRDRGMTVAVDDFGTGYSSLSYIGKLPIDTIKIDRSFVANVEQDHAHRQVIASIVALARTLDLETVAEGVETEAQRDWLTQIGCTSVQGYLTGRPMPLDAFIAFLEHAAQGKARSATS